MPSNVITKCPYQIGPSVLCVGIARDVLCRSGLLSMCACMCICMYVPIGLYRPSHTGVESTVGSTMRLSLLESLDDVYEFLSPPLFALAQ